MQSGVEGALEEIEKLFGWRAFFLLAPEAADANGIVEALPWAEGGPGLLRDEPGCDHTN